MALSRTVINQSEEEVVLLTAEEEGLDESTVREVIREVHLNLGHAGIIAVENTIKDYYKVKHLRRYIEEELKNCDVCFKLETSESKWQNNQLGISKPFQRVHIDTIGPLPEIDGREERYIIVAKDALTKWIEVKATVNKKASTIVRFTVDEIICRHGKPETLVSDNGTEYVNRSCWCHQVVEYREEGKR